MVVLNFWYNYLETIQFDLQMSIFDFDCQVAWFLMKYTPVLLNEQTNRSKKYASPHFLSQNFSGKQFWSKSEHFLNFWYQKSRNLAVEKKFFCDFSYHWAMRTNISKICDYCIFSEVFFRSAEQCGLKFDSSTSIESAFDIFSPLHNSCNMPVSTTLSIKEGATYHIKWKH